MRSIEPDPSACWENVRAVVNTVIDNAQVLWLSPCAVVLEDARVTDISAGEVRTEMESVRAYSKAGREDSTARDAASLVVYCDRAIDPRKWKIDQISQY